MTEEAQDINFLEIAVQLSIILTFIGGVAFWLWKKLKNYLTAWVRSLAKGAEATANEVRTSATSPTLAKLMEDTADQVRQLREENQTATIRYETTMEIARAADLKANQALSSLETIRLQMNEMKKGMDKILARYQRDHPEGRGHTSGRSQD